MSIKFVATCLTHKQKITCQNMDIETPQNYARSYSEIAAGCVTDFSVHCFNSAALLALKELGVSRATLHPELNLAQIRDIKKCIPTEVVIYGKIPMMYLGNPLKAIKPPRHTNSLFSGIITDRKGAKFYVNNGIVYNSVPIFAADKLNQIEKTGITHGRFIFTTESDEEVRAVVGAYMAQKPLKIPFTRGYL
ncbi:MAG: U32 family peptidase [Defluviitaleaceae bacterium]|nr:U32 family peptidase [Defluviitaleaceae bacterium]